MSDERVDLRDQAEAATRVEATASPQEALAAMEAGGSRFGVVEGPGGEFRGTVDRDSLQAVAGEEEAVESLLKGRRLPPAVTGQVDLSAVSTDSLKSFDLRLRKSRAQCVAVFEGGKATQVLPRVAVDRALLRSSMIEDLDSRSLGVGVAPRRLYVCEVPGCGGRVLVRQGPDIPDCPEDFFHGPMRVAP